MERVFVVLGAALAFTAVALGAFGSHGLQGRVSPEDVAIFETGVRYHMYHALALLAAAGVAARWSGIEVVVAGWLFVGGILVFSGSLYLLVLTDTRWLGAVTPVGGLAFLVGWLLLAVGAIRGGP